jgi:hypothetical protein
MAPTGIVEAIDVFAEWCWRVGYAAIVEQVFFLSRLSWIAGKWKQSDDAFL